MKKLKQFEEKLHSVVERQKIRVISTVESKIEDLKKIQLTVFSNNDPYRDEEKNKVFFTY